jgi:hypothetical protein
VAAMPSLEALKVQEQEAAAAGRRSSHTAE